MSKPRILVVIGTRPQFIKSFPLLAAFSEIGVGHFLVDTGQHWDHNLSSAFLDDLKIKRPDLTLKVHQQGHALVTAEILSNLEKALLPRDFDLAVVFGDTNSSLAASLWASKHRLPIAHVEAGLRSLDRTMPEEVNRVMVDHVSSIHFCPTESSVQNLLREGISDRVFNVGDLMYDAVKMISSRKIRPSRILKNLNLEDGEYCLLTVHREENTSSREALSKVLSFVEAQAVGPVIFPLHPRTEIALRKYGLGLEGFITTTPVAYRDMMYLLSKSRHVFTDSGGLQKEAAFLKIKCTTLRSSTEWPETIESGWNRLWTEPEYQPEKEMTGFGDGDAAHKIALIIAKLFSR